MSADTPRVRQNARVANTPFWKMRLDPEKRRDAIRAANAAGTDLTSLLKLGIDAILTDARAFAVACHNIIRGEK